MRIKGGMTRAFTILRRVFKLVANADAATARQEYHVTSKLDHPNIIRMEMNNTSDGVLLDMEMYVNSACVCIVRLRLRDIMIGLLSFHTPRAEMGSLLKAFATGLIAPAWRIAIARQFARAVAYLHRHGIMHRDLKPANLLLTGDFSTELKGGVLIRRSGSSGRVIVADFGFATTGVERADRAGTTRWQCSLTISFVAHQ
jgi:serine/threonine protein kinase